MNYCLSLVKVHVRLKKYLSRRVGAFVTRYFSWIRTREIIASGRRRLRSKILKDAFISAKITLSDNFQYLPKILNKKFVRSPPENLSNTQLYPKFVTKTREEIFSRQQSVDNFSALLLRKIKVVDSIFFFRKNNV